MEAIQYLGQVVVGVLVIGGFGESHDVGNLQGGKFHALQSIAIGVLAVAQVVAGAAIGIALPDSVAQHIFHIAFTPAGGDEGILVPDTVLDGVRPIIFENRQRAGGVRVNGGVCRICCQGRGDTAEKQHQGHHQGKKLLHFVTFPFLFLI